MQSLILVEENNMSNLVGEYSWTLWLPSAQSLKNSKRVFHTRWQRQQQNDRLSVKVSSCGSLRWAQIWLWLL